VAVFVCDRGDRFNKFVERSATALQCEGRIRSPKPMHRHVLLPQPLNQRSEIRIARDDAEALDYAAVEKVHGGHGYSNVRAVLAGAKMMPDIELMPFRNLEPGRFPAGQQLAMQLPDHRRADRLDLLLE